MQLQPSSRRSWLYLWPAVVCLGFLTCAAEASDRWSIEADGGILWRVKPGEAHADAVEMSGRRVALIVRYAVAADGSLTVRREMSFPGLRLLPVETGSHVWTVFGEDVLPQLTFNRRWSPPPRVVTESVRLRGLIEIQGVMELHGTRQLAWTRTLFPATEQPLAVEQLAFTNITQKSIVLELADTRKTTLTLAARGLEGAYRLDSRILDPGERILAPGETARFTLVFAAQPANAPDLTVDASAEARQRGERISLFLTALRLETPDPILNTLFDFAKIRATESIFATRGGLMHSPGGGYFYAAVWANDEAEYANPFFPFLGDRTGVDSAINAYRLFADYLNPGFKPLPSSVIAEGAAAFSSAGDRGDMAMIAYGAARFALASGDRDVAEKLWPLIDWCLEYCRRQLNPHGVVASDSDELEGRFPAGKANLCTSALYYDALQSAVFLGRDLGRPEKQLTEFAARASALRAAIEAYFGATVEGFSTYRYYDKNDLAGEGGYAAYADKPDVLRSWICVPLTMGILDRKDGTLAALFSPRLWTPDGLVTEAGQKTVWDRSTLYALRGAFIAGSTQQALDHLEAYSRRRLLGDRAPYPIESSGGDEPQLSAESALYCRIYLEGIFGIRPTGLRSFSLTPRLPRAWPMMALRRVHAFGREFDLIVAHEDGGLKVQVLAGGKPVIDRLIADGATVTVDLPPR